MKEMNKKHIRTIEAVIQDEVDLANLDYCPPVTNEQWNIFVESFIECGKRDI